LKTRCRRSRQDGWAAAHTVAMFSPVITLLLSCTGEHHDAPPKADGAGSTQTACSETRNSWLGLLHRPPASWKPGRLLPQALQSWAARDKYEAVKEYIVRLVMQKEAEQKAQRRSSVQAAGRVERFARLAFLQAGPGVVALMLMCSGRMPCMHFRKLAA
jgi:hypothetical protein